MVYDTIYFLSIGTHVILIVLVSLGLPCHQFRYILSLLTDRNDVESFYSTILIFFFLCVCDAIVAI